MLFRTIAAVAACLFATAALAADGEPANHPTQTEPVAQLTVAELNELVDNTNFIVNGGCSGTLISLEHKLILTAYHCVNDLISFVEKDKVVAGIVEKEKVEVRQDVTVEQKFYDGPKQVGGASYKASIVAYDESSDLALLQVRQGKIPMALAVRLLPTGREAQRGEGVYVVGNPAGYDASITAGIIVSTSREMEAKAGAKVSLIQTDAEVFFGNSGGVMMTRDGYYIGTISRGIPGTAVIFAIHYDHIRAMLKENCFEELYNDEPEQTFAACDAERKAEEEEKETIEDLLRKFIEGQADERS